MLEDLLKKILEPEFIATAVIGGYIVKGLGYRCLYHQIKKLAREEKFPSKNAEIIAAVERFKYACMLPTPLDIPALFYAIAKIKR